MKAKPNPLRDVLIEISHRAAEHHAAGREVQFREANAICDLIKARLTEKWVANWERELLAYGNGSGMRKNLEAGTKIK